MMRNITGFLILALAVSIVAGCGSSEPEKKAEPQGGLVTAAAKMGNLATDPIAQMSFEFEGNPPKDQIQEKVDKVLMMYMLEANDNNRSMAGRTLVMLRKTHGHSEMSILDKMISSPVEGKFEEAAEKIDAAM